MLEIFISWVTAVTITHRVISDPKLMVGEPVLDVRKELFVIRAALKVEELNQRIVGDVVDLSPR